MDIFEVAVGLFMENGYDNTPMSSIARAAGLSKAGLYHHFPSKEDLLFHIIDHLMQKDLLPIMERSETIEDPRERLEYFVREYTTLIATEGNAQVVIHEAKRLRDSDYKKIVLGWQKVFRLIKNCVTQMQAQGQMKTLNSSFVSFALIGMCTWTFYWFDRTRPEAVEELKESYLEIMLRGLLA
jgi:AcrR family transcriptional regulator